MSVICLFVGGSPIHHLHILGGVVPTRDNVGIMLVVLHDCKIFGREFEALAALAYRLCYK